MNRTKSLFKRTITIALLFVMVFNLSGNLVYGLQEVIMQTPTVLDEEIGMPPPPKEEEPVEILDEIEDKRELDTKYFMTSNRNRGSSKVWNKRAL